jgi:hypothetical protein
LKEILKQKQFIKATSKHIRALLALLLTEEPQFGVQAKDSLW